MGNSDGARLADKEPVVLGVGLDQYAGVTAALAEGIALREVLAQERIGEAAWPAADRAWKEALVEAPDLHLRYMRLRRQAEDCLSRRIEPLEEDPAAWAGLLGALALIDEPERVLQSLGLRMADVGRLGRLWRGKAEKDSAVADRLSTLAGKAKPPKLVRCGPTVLRPFPWTPPARSSAEPAAGALPAGGSRHPADPDSALVAPKSDNIGRPEQLPTYLAAQRMGPSLPFEPVPHVDAGVLPPGMRGFLDVHGTQLAPEGPPAGPVLPFAADAGSRAPSAMTSEDAPESQLEPSTISRPARLEIPVGMRGLDDLHGTQAATDAPAVGPVLPFEPAAPPQPSVVPAGMQHFNSVSDTEMLPTGIPKGMQGFLDVEGTRAALDAPAGPVLPFSALPSPVPQTTLEQYAQMCVELALYPAQKLDILRRHGIDDEQRRRLDGYWGARVREDASMRAAWDRHYAEHWARLRDPQGSRR